MDRKSEFELLRRLAASICELFAPFCEVVIHDFSDIEHSIICIEGSISGRSVGGGPTDLLLSRAKKGDTDDDLGSYLTSLPGGRLMKSSTVFLRDDQDAAYGAFCVNFDISPFLVFQHQLEDFLETEERESITEMLSDDIRETIQSMVAETVYELGTDGGPFMSREDKIELIARLNSKGVFQVKKAVQILADLLGLSRATVYNYLRAAQVTGAAESTENNRTLV